VPDDLQKTAAFPRKGGHLWIKMERWRAALDIRNISIINA
jgi:hypothetical protein